MADEKCYKLGTGGGPNLKTEISPIDNTILEILGSARVEGFPSEFGGDAVTVPEENVEPLQDDSEFLYDCEENNNTVLRHPLFIAGCLIFACIIPYQS
ncbi:hypothetical protein JTB14_018882 [Gonioctena quinquepunctata]|nr:hypothetical protein JTB14_018882 [Gonioctena quinquepunctata]